MIKKCKILLEYKKSRVFKYDKGLQGPMGFLSNWFSINKKGNSRENFINCVMKEWVVMFSRDSKPLISGE